MIRQLNGLKITIMPVISNGPFYLESYAPESRTITVKAFEDDSYPFKIGKWSKFENTEFPNIKKID